jgi:hypothetical protein
MNRGTVVESMKVYSSRLEEKVNAEVVAARSDSYWLRMARVRV